MSKDLQDECKGVETNGCISRQKSEIVAPRTSSAEGTGKVHVREVTFDDLFRQKFIPLDSRKKVGNYVIGKIIGEGTFSKVREARHVTNSEKRAVKVLPKKTILKRPDVRRRFMREVKSLRKITHRNIVHIHEVMETAGNYYIVMDLLKGDNFKEYLNKRKRLVEDEAKHFMYQVVDAVHYMHSRGIVHRDMKPENIILNGDLIKIVDFGLCACIKEGDIMTTQCGSPAYAAPEIFSKEPYTKLVDVWSIGVILFLAVTGCMPFNIAGKSSTQVYTMFLKGFEIPNTLQLSEACETLISQMLTVNPDYRILTSDILLHPWFKKNTGRSQPMTTI
ncbi:uncharacterized protein LOC123551011 [Mercenaria mercenaria]|uniref:uncharacterized protein LOC123551011 n=1 Tax=Mercenaria mercenaria TaxID=6596 RepID=UPI00234F367B|nr:uncharacterized protein LOC123551011 [Mercenaria mercenaria]